MYQHYRFSDLVKTKCRQPTSIANKMMNTRFTVTCIEMVLLFIFLNMIYVINQFHRVSRDSFSVLFTTNHAMLNKVKNASSKIKMDILKVIINSKIKD